MKKIFLILCCFFFSGCAVNSLLNVKLGMTKEQAFAHCSYPEFWSRQVINDRTYESFYFNPFEGTLNFVDGILVGYSQRDPFGNIKYYSEKGVEDFRNYKNSKNP